MLDKDPSKRPNIFNVLTFSLVSNKIKLIVDEFILGVETTK